MIQLIRIRSIGWYNKNQKNEYSIKYIYINDTLYDGYY